MQLTNSFGSFLVATLTATMAAGAVVPAKGPYNVPRGSYEIKRAANEHFTGRNGPLALARAYAKYGVPVSKTLIKAVENISLSHNVKRSNGTGSAPATPDDNDLEYLVPVKIGTPAQTLNLDFDTGSADLWVFSSETDASSSQGHSIYTPDKSSTAKKQEGATWSITYGDQSSSSGDVYTDTVTFGGLTVDNQAVESAQKVSDQFAKGKNDGLVGLAFSSINTVKPQAVKTWFDNIVDSLDAPVFTADLKHEEPGSYLFGGIPDEAKDVLYAPVDNSDGFWKFSSSSDSGANFDAIADTGTTLLLASEELVDGYYKQVDGAKNDPQQGGYVFACDAKLPDFTFTVGDGKITIPGKLINYAPAGGDQCFGGIQSAAGLPFAIFGDIALKAAYVVFDAGKTQVGWAQKA